MESITTVTPILRFNFSEEVMTMISDFAKVHRFDDRHAYKEHWEAWFEENNDELALEIYRLEKNGYKGDVKDKMYKAGRYYFRKKDLVIESDLSVADADANANAEPNADKTKRTYIAMDKSLIEAMDKHIISSMRTQTAYSLPFKPAIGWTDFYKTHEVLIQGERTRLSTIGTDTIIDEKIKKTYKNRYFIITR